jgi:hypothetical protein
MTACRTACCSSDREASNFAIKLFVIIHKGDAQALLNCGQCVSLGCHGLFERVFWLCWNSESKD